MAVHYLEIVSNDADTLTGLYQRMHALSFGPPGPDLGQARVATQADGSLVGARKPLATVACCSLSASVRSTRTASATARSTMC